MLQLTRNFTQGVCNFSSHFGSVRDEFFSHCLVWNFSTADVYDDCDWHFRRDFVATPIHGCYYTVRNIACLIVQQWDFVGKTVNHESATLGHIASVCHSQLNDEWVTSIS